MPAYKHSLSWILVIGIVTAVVVFSFGLLETHGATNTDTETTDTPELSPEEFMQIVKAPPLPVNPVFCGESLDMNDPEISERLDKEIIVNSFLHSATILYIKRAHRFFPIIEEILKEEGVPDDMKYLCVAESGLTHAISPAGAKGFWQFMKEAAKEHGLTIDEDIDERYDIVLSTKAACRYLKKSRDKFGSWTLAAAAYNAGNQGIFHQINSQKVDNYYDLHLNTETSRYIFRIIALKYIMLKPEQYGFFIPQQSLYKPFDYQSIWVDEKNVDWISFALNNKTTYKSLLYHNPKIIKKDFTNKNGRKIEIKLPEK
jgi:membrane-bound lytic murein transglycosylase D